MIAEVDATLQEELKEIGLAIEQGDLESHLRAEVMSGTRWDEMFAEIRDPQG